MFSVCGSFWVDMYNHVKSFLTLFDEITNYVRMVGDIFNALPPIFLSVISIMIIIGLVFGLFHLVIVIFT